MYCITTGVKVTVDTVIIVEHKLQDGASSDVIQEVSEFMKNYTLKRTQQMTNDSSTRYLEVKYHKFFPRESVNAEIYDLISVINEGNNDTLSWPEIKDNYKMFIEKLVTGEYSDDNVWSTALFPMDESEDRGTVDISLLGISVTLSYRQSCAKYPDACEATKGTVRQ